MAWTLIIRGRVLIFGNINAHNIMWNPQSQQSKNAGLLEELIQSFDLIVNNDIDFFTRLSSQEISIIDLTLTSPELGLFQVWEIPKEYPSLSDHELILIKCGNIET